MQTAIFAGGCFWCLDAVFSRVPGVITVEPGYTGGQLANPDYAAVCRGDSGHAEAVRVRFDAARVDYAQLLAVFFASHDPTTLNRQGHDIGSQYRSAIFALDSAQQDAACRAIAAHNAALTFGAALVTTLEAAAPFWPAEIEHHGYFAAHANAPYCQAVIAPKLAQLLQRAVLPAAPASDDD